MATQYSNTRVNEINANDLSVLIAEINTLIPGNIMVPNGTVKDPGGETVLGMGGSVTVSNQLVENNSIILVTALDGMSGTLSVENRTAGTSFDIISSGGVADGGKKVNWLIINLEP